MPLNAIPESDPTYPYVSKFNLKNLAALFTMNITDRTYGELQVAVDKFYNIPRNTVLREL